jgi:hypothetical protein
MDEVAKLEKKIRKLSKADEVDEARIAKLKKKLAKLSRKSADDKQEKPEKKRKASYGEAEENLVKKKKKDAHLDDEVTAEVREQNTLGSNTLGASH